VHPVIKSAIETAMVAGEEAMEQYGCEKPPRSHLISVSTIERRRSWWLASSICDIVLRRL
jgi:hypothetical protein